MAIITVPQFEMPSLLGWGGVAPAFTSATTLDASGEECGWVLSAPKSGNIRRIGFLTGTVTTPTDTDVRVETVTARFPSGTLFGTDTNGTVASASITATTVVFATLTADAAVTKGETFGITVTPSGSPNFQVVRSCGEDRGPQLPYVYLNLGGSQSNSTAPPVMWLEYSDGSYAETPQIYPISTFTTHTINTGTTPDEVALLFQVAAPMRVSGYWLGSVDLDNSADVILYDSDGTSPLLTSALSPDTRQGTAVRGPYARQFSSTATLLAATDYYLAYKPSSASSSIVYSMNFVSTDSMGMLPGGSNFRYAQRTNAGGWTPTTTRRPIMGLLINGIDDGVSTGGTAGWW